ncbi:MAG: dihydropteroate synthase [Dehalococcoidales bacterium]|nr:dihydropteroate synthase [Dehalococcoidales bacterium]
MILVAENINTVSRSIGTAFRERNDKPVKELTVALTKSGADMLDLNIGPSRKEGAELMDWLVKTVEEVSPLSLALDTTNADAIEAGLQAASKPALINSVSLQPERLEKLLPLANKYNVDIIGLLWGTEGMPRDANERCMLAVDLVYQAGEAGIPPERIWIDPIATPVTVDIFQVKSCLECMSMLSEIAPGCRSIVGLSNISSGAPSHLRGYFNRTFLAMLIKYGLDAAICDTLDTELVQIARGQLSSVVDLVHRLMEGEEVDPARLDDKQMEYYKTYRVLSGDVLYSDSWLEI